MYDNVVTHDAARVTEIDYPESLRSYAGPLLMLVEAEGFSIGQLLMKY